MKRAGAFICSLGKDSIDALDDPNENKAHVKWIRKDTRTTNITSPIEILIHGYEKLKNDSRWRQKQREAYHSLMKKLTDA